METKSPLSKGEAHINTFFLYIIHSSHECFDSAQNDRQGQISAKNSQLQMCVMQ